MQDPPPFHVNWRLEKEILGERLFKVATSVSDRLIPWEGFRAKIEAVALTPDELKKQRRPEAV